MILDLFSLAGRVAVVTGAGRGIGAAIATALAEVGADVAIGARTEEQLEGVAAEIRGLGRRAVVVAGSLAERAGSSASSSARWRARALDFVVKNVGGASPGPSRTRRPRSEPFRWTVTTAVNLTRWRCRAARERSRERHQHCVGRRRFNDRGFTPTAPRRRRLPLSQNWPSTRRGSRERVARARRTDALGICSRSGLQRAWSSTARASPVTASRRRRSTSLARRSYVTAGARGRRAPPRQPRDGIPACNGRFGRARGEDVARRASTRG